MAANWVTALKKLQDKDLRIRVLCSKLEMIPKEKLSLKEQANKNNARAEQVKNDVLSLELELKKSESRIAEYKETIHKLETQSNMVKKNTEYQAMLVSIADYKNKISNEESRGIELLDSIDSGKKTYRSVVADVKLENAALKAEFMDLDALANDLKKEVASLTAERTSLAENVEDDILRRYESLLKKGIGSPLAAVRSGICENCHLKVTPQTLNSAAKGAVVYCDNCQHFIYLED